MLDFILIIGFIGSIITIISWCSSIISDRHILHAIYLFILVILVSATYIYKSELNIVNNAEINAMNILENRINGYTTNGFIQASLTFLEKHKDLYPDSYTRALKICELHNCLENNYSERTKDSFYHSYSQNEVSYAFDGILRGIIDMNKKVK